MQLWEYRVLETRQTLTGSAWFEEGGERLGRWNELQSILNQLGAFGWEVVGFSMGATFSRVILKRPSQPGEVAPSALPEGRGDEVTPPVLPGQTG